MAKNKVYAKINGSEYTIAGDEPEDYLFKISRYLDKKIKDTLLANPKHSNTSAAVLTALMVTDELFQLKKEVADLKKAISGPEDKLLLLEEEILQERADKAELVRAVDELKGAARMDAENLSQLQDSYNELYENFMKKNMDLEQALNDAQMCRNQMAELDKEYSELKEKTRELKDELLESEIENVKINKELKNMKESANRRNTI